MSAPTASNEPFAVLDSSLARCAVGRSCTNLRELQDAVRTVPDAVLEHHMMHCVLDDHFELYEFPNDLARWSWEALGDHALAEQLGLVDAYRMAPPALRSAVLDAIEDHLWGIERVPWCRPGLELHLIQSRLVAFDTGERLPTPAALREALPRLSLRSLYFHVHEAYRRTSGQTDDFSAWLEGYGADANLVGMIRGIDFNFLNLSQLRQKLIDVFQEHLPDSTAASKATS